MDDKECLSRLGLLADCTSDPLPMAKEILKYWCYDLYSRRPGPALMVDGALCPTDLDLACFLSGLADRGAIVNLPVYKSARPRTVRSDEHVVSRDNRHGKVTGFVSNKAMFSFSVRVQDMNVVKIGSDGKEDSMGAPRNFMLVGLDGEWRKDGWRTIEFFPTAKENAFLTDNKLWTGNRVVFQNFVHPNRWVSFYGRPYFVTKALVQRLVDERAFLQAELKRFPSKTLEAAFARDGEDGPESETVEGDTKVCTAFEAEVHLPRALRESVSDAAFIRLTDDTADDARKRSHEIQYVLLPQLRFIVRSTELAFLNAYKVNPNMKPGWMEKSEGFRDLLVKRTTWRTIEMPHVGAGADVRWRQWEKKETVTTAAITKARGLL